jgi:hypothetical protein
MYTESVTDKCKKIAVVQSNYIPWKGYFDLIAAVDEFILYDDMQFTKNDWRNRNKIKTSNGPSWISVPVGQDISRRIRDVVLPNQTWQKNHWRTIELNYRRSPYFHEIADWVEPLYISQTYTHLSALNRQFIVTICRYLGITTVISNSWDYQLIEGKIERLVDLCVKAGGTEYISGPSARNYLDERVFAEAGIKLTWFDYQGYPEYPQLWGDFIHGVSILDLLFNCGKVTPQFMRYVCR